MVDVSTTATILQEVSAVHVHLDLDVLATKLETQPLTTVLVLSNIALLFLLLLLLLSISKKLHGNVDILSELSILMICTYAHIISLGAYILKRVLNIAKKFHFNLPRSEGLSHYGLGLSLSIAAYC